MIDITKNLSIEQYNRKTWTLNATTTPNNLPPEFTGVSLPIKYTYNITIREKKNDC